MNTATANYFSGYSNKAMSRNRLSVCGKKQSKSRGGFISVIIFISIFLVSAGYFIEINSVASLGYEIKGYQKSIDDLKNENQKMKVTISQSVSLKNIEDPAQLEKMNLVKSIDNKYLAMPSSNVAKK